MVTFFFLKFYWYDTWMRYDNYYLLSIIHCFFSKLFKFWQHLISVVFSRLSSTQATRDIGSGIISHNIFPPTHTLTCMYRQPHLSVNHTLPRHHPQHSLVHRHTARSSIYTSGPQHRCIHFLHNYLTGKIPSVYQTKKSLKNYIKSHLITTPAYMLSKGYKYKQEMKLNRYVEVHYMFKCL